MKSKNFNFNIILLCVSILTLIASILFTSLYFTTKNIIEEKLGLSAKNIAVATSVSIMTNIEEYQDFLISRDKNSNYYINIQQKLANIKDGSNIKYLYIINIIDKNNIEYIISADNTLDNQEYITNSENIIMLEKVIKNKETHYFKSSNYRNDGNFTIAYSPIIDKNNNVIGVLGAAIDLQNLFESFNRLIFSMISTFVVLLFFVIFLLKKLIPFITEPMNKDKLTNAYNKRYYEDYIKDKINKIIKKDGEVAVMMLDLDHFKSINDTYGHPFGDKVLSSVAANIKNHLRSDDYFIRYGGEEFLLILTQINKKTSLEIAERIRKNVEIEPIFNEDKQIDINVTISIGITYINKPNKNISKLIDDADHALYQAKITRNKVYLFQKEKKD